jgi:putative endonuclease
MHQEKHYYVYILTNRPGTLCTRSTNDLERRVWEHKRKVIPGFTNKYNIVRLVYWEDSLDLFAARATARSRSRPGREPSASR